VLLQLDAQLEFFEKGGKGVVRRGCVLGAKGGRQLVYNVSLGSMCAR